MSDVFAGVVVPNPPGRMEEGKIDYENLNSYFSSLSVFFEDMMVRMQQAPLMPNNGAITAEVDETKFSHKMAIVINGETYYIMLTKT